MMIKLPNTNAVFVCPQKVASTSIKRAILQSFDIPLSKGRAWEKDHAIRAEDITDEDVYAFVRNPFDRLVSCYHNQCLSENRYKLGKNCKFSDFVSYVSGQDRISADKHFKPLSLTIPSDITFVGRFESLQRDWDYIRWRLPILTRIKHENKTKVRKHWSAYYDTKGLKTVYEYYREDFERFRY